MLSADHIASLYDRHGPEVLRYLARRTFDPETAVDLLSETFTRAILQRRKFRGSTDEEAIGWVYAIAANLLVDQRRRDRRERDAALRDARARRPLEPEEFEEVERLLDLRELRDTVALALEELSPEHREVLRLRVIEERSYPALAQAIGTSEPAARARVSRALRALRTAPAIVEHREELHHA
ncbi:MAG: sigma-70 family RNA polymerase sigma factor [Solirubrobacteraceae bacterium]|nr:sigma-70 family RNA polymerase sigma factor [Solirubrobacteraceae bacterium]